MFDYPTWEQSLRDALYAGIPAAGLDPDTEVAWPNRDFTTPTGQHLRVFVNFEDADQMDIGDTQAGTVYGRVVLRYYTPKGSGNQAHQGAIKALSPILHGKTIDGIVCESSAPSSLNRRDRWWVTEITTLFEVAH